MPNWCEGTLKVRGKKEDLIRFILECLKPVDYFGNLLPPLKMDEHNVIRYSDMCHIKGTHKGFVKRIWEFTDSFDEIETICLDAKFAWSINADDLLAICKEFNVDMKIYAFEMGMEFNQEIEIVSGEVIYDNEITFDDYDWECICPNMGG